MSGETSEPRPDTDPTIIRIGLLWHSARSGNLGVGALTVANMAILRDVAADLGLSPRFTIIGMRDAERPYLRPDEAEEYLLDTRALLKPGGCWAVIGRQDCLVDIGAGDSFADIYGLKRFMFLWLTKMMAIVRRRPLLLAPQTIGPFTRSPYRQMARVALERAHGVIARDDASFAALKALAPRAKGDLAVDVAFALSYVDRSAERGGALIRVGVNVSGLLFNQAVSGANRFGLSYDYARVMRSFLTDLSARPDVEVHLIRHVVTPSLPNDDDGGVADLLRVEFPDFIVAPVFDGPSEAKSYISSLDFLVAARMHACVAAFSSGTPVVPVSYSRKFSGLFGMLGYNWLVPVTGLDETGVLNLLNDALSQRRELALAEAAGMQKVGDLLDVYRARARDLLRLASGR